MAKRSNFPQIRGFEFYPEGKLLTQRVDFDGPVGIAYERCVGYTKDKHTHDRMTITFPRGSSRSFIKTFPEAKKYSLNQEVVHLMAKDHVHEQGSVSAIYDTFALFVIEEHYVKHLERLGAKAAEIRAFLKTTQSIPKNPILAEAIQRYFFCRVLQGAGPIDPEVLHLESFLLSEIFFLCRKSAGGKARDAEAVQASAEASDEIALLKAIEYIESHLFEKLEVAALVAASRTSQATLFRLFKRELKASPIEYVRNRRLDEARILLKTGNYQVGDVSLLVGYEDLGSFSKAFRSRFKVSPSQDLPKRGT